MLCVVCSSFLSCSLGLQQWLSWVCSRLPSYIYASIWHLRCVFNWPNAFSPLWIEPRRAKHLWLTNVSKYESLVDQFHYSHSASFSCSLIRQSVAVSSHCLHLFEEGLPGCRILWSLYQFFNNKFPLLTTLIAKVGKVQSNVLQFMHISLVFTLKLTINLTNWHDLLSSEAFFFFLL